MPRPDRWLWGRLAQHPHAPIAVYLALAGWGGVASGGGISPTSLDVLPGWLVAMWTVAVALGGTATVLGVLTAWTRMESAGLALLAYGATLYGLVGAVILWPGSVMVIALSAAVVSMCLIRMRILALARYAQHVASQISRDEQEGGR